MKKVIDMEKRGDVFVPIVTRNKTRVLADSKNQPRRKESSTRLRSEPQQIGKILEGMVTDFFKIMRNEMFR